MLTNTSPGFVGILVSTMSLYLLTTVSSKAIFISTDIVIFFYFQ